MENVMNLWNNVGANGGSEKKEVKYVKFPVGTSVIRLLDVAPYSRPTHWISKANNGKGVGIDCIGKNCPICEVIRTEKKEKLQTKTYTSKMTHSINVLVKKLGGQDVNEVMVLEQGNGLFGQIKDQMTLLAQMGMSPDLRNVDIVINRTGTGFSDTKYSVMVNQMTMKPLTEEEKALEKYNLEEIKPKLNEAQVIMLMNGKSLDEVCTDEFKEEDNSVGDVFTNDVVDFSMPY